MGSSRKYTKEILEPLVSESISYADLIRKLGLKWSGGTQNHLSKLCREYGLSTQHMLGQRANSGLKHTGGYAKKKPEEYLVQRPSGSPRQKAERIRNALLEIGRPYLCNVCNQKPEWNGKPLCLHIDHIDGNLNDDRKENLRFLCPNCHDQTLTWGKRKQK